MIYDYAGREIKETAPVSSRLLTWEPQDRYVPEVTRGLSPRSLDGILMEANVGNVRAQALLARELEEKDFQSAHAIGVRRAAVQGLKWKCSPPAGNENNPQAKAIAEAAEAMLRAIAPQDANDDISDFSGLLGDLMGALLPGYSCTEILWDDGGARILGFGSVASHAITFLASRQPLIVCTNAPQGLPLIPRKFVFHRHKTRSGDVARSGLIRPLGWMFCFANLGIKDLLRFVERYGMPFLLARLDESSWKTERGVIAELVRNFGSDGGGVFTKAVEAQLIEASGTGDVYFKLMEFFGAWKTKTILGQLASSEEASGWSSGDAQSQVRRDLLESDVAQIAATIRRDALAPWVAFNYGAGAVVPELQLIVDEAVDFKLKSEVVLNLKNAGKTVTDDYVERTFGVELEEPASPDAALAAPFAPVRKQLAAPSDALALADRSTTPRQKRQAAVQLAQEANDQVASTALQQVTQNTRLMTEWLGPVAEAVAEALAELPEPLPDGSAPAGAMDLFQQRLHALLQSIPGLMDEMDTTRLEAEISGAMFAGDANGRALAASAIQI